MAKTDPCPGPWHTGDAAGTGAPAGPWSRHPPRDVTFQSPAGEGRGQNKTSPRLNPARSRQHHRRAPLLLHALAFCFPFCPGDKVRMPKPLVQHSSGIWVSFSSLPQENFKLKKKLHDRRKKKKKKIITPYSSSTT